MYDYNSLADELYDLIESVKAARCAEMLDGGVQAGHLIDIERKLEAVKKKWPKEGKPS